MSSMSLLNTLVAMHVHFSGPDLFIWKGIELEENTACMQRGAARGILMGVRSLLSLLVDA